MSTKQRTFDAARYLDSDETIAEYITAALEDGEPAVIAHALGVVARQSQLTRMPGRRARPRP